MTATKSDWRPWGSGPNVRYEVNSAGRVRCARTRRLLKQYPNHNGYLRVRLICADGARRWWKVHTLVLELFVGPRPSPRHHGAHTPDRDKQNNRVSNLRWSLPEENEADKRAHGTARGGIGRRLEPSHVAEIRSRAANGESFTRLAKAHGLHRHSVSRIVRGIRHSEKRAS